MKEFYFKISSRVKVRARNEQEATRKFRAYMEDFIEVPGMAPDTGIFLSIEDALDDWEARVEYELGDFDSSEDELTDEDLRLNEE